MNLLPMTESQSRKFQELCRKLQYGSSRIDVFVTRERLYEGVHPFEGVKVGTYMGKRARGQRVKFNELDFRLDIDAALREL